MTAKPSGKHRYRVSVVVVTLSFDTAVGAIIRSERVRPARVPKWGFTVIVSDPDAYGGEMTFCIRTGDPCDASGRAHNARVARERENRALIYLDVSSPDISPVRDANLLEEAERNARSSACKTVELVRGEPHPLLQRDSLLWRDPAVDVLTEAGIPAEVAFLRGQVPDPEPTMRARLLDQIRKEATDWVRGQLDSAIEEVMSSTDVWVQSRPDQGDGRDQLRRTAHLAVAQGGG